MVTSQLAERLRTDVLALGGDPSAVDPVMADLDDRYGEPHRAYHTWSHIVHVLEMIDWISLRVVVERPRIVVAGLFHDAVYDPTAAAGDNERRSADLARTACALLDVPDEVARHVGRLVEVTATHRSDERPGQVLCDADLAVLASDGITYDLYRRAVRVEYQHLDEATWRAGRAAVLRALLARDRIFVTAPMRDRGEAVARSNIARELTALER